MIRIETRPGACGAICASILGELEEWFGLEEANAAYARAAEEHPVWLALDGEQPVGLMLLTRHEDALEIHLLAVRLARRNAGIGRALVEEALAEARRQAVPFLTVKTLGPSAESAEYAETRAFYRACGFAVLEEFPDLWDPENPALFMARTA